MIAKKAIKKMDEVHALCIDIFDNTYEEKFSRNPVAAMTWYWENGWDPHLLGEDFLDLSPSKKYLRRLGVQRVKTAERIMDLLDALERGNALLQSWTKVDA